MLESGICVFQRSRCRQPLLSTASIRLADRRSHNFCHKKDRFNVSVRTAYCADDLTCACDSANIAEAYVRERSNAEINCNDEDAAVLVLPPGSRRRRDVIDLG